MLGATLRQLNPIFWATQTQRICKDKKTEHRQMMWLQLRNIPVRLRINCINDTLWFGHKVQQLLCYNRTIRLTGCGICTACSDIQTSQRGKLDFYWTIWSTLKKKSQCSIYQAYEVLHEYIYIDIYLNLFRKALQSHIIPYNSYW